MRVKDTLNENTKIIAEVLKETCCPSKIKKTIQGDNAKLW